MKLGIIVFCVILFFAISFDFFNFQWHLGNLEYFFDLPSLIIVLVPTIVFAIGAYSWETYGKTWSIPFGNPENNEQSELVEVNKCLNFMSNMSVVMGIIGTFLGFILLLQNFHNIGENQGPASAVGLITIFMVFFSKHFLCLHPQKLKNILSSIK